MRVFEDSLDRRQARRADRKGMTRRGENVMRAVWSTRGFPHHDYRVTFCGLADCEVYAATVADEGGNLPPEFVQNRRRKFISDPLYGTGLKDPGGTELSQSGWVKFVWIDACYSNVIWSGTLNDMARAFGMNSPNNDPPFGDQSYIGFNSLTPNGFYNQWVSVVYTWTFWYYLCVASGVEPDWYVYQAWADKVPWQVTQWALLGYPWTTPLEYMIGISDISYPSWTAKLKDHIGE